MRIIFLFSGKQLEYIPKKREIFKVDFQKKQKPGDIIAIDRVLSQDENFGHPYLNLVLQAEILKHGIKKKIIIFKYKPKKRYKVKRGYRAQYTEIKIIGVKEKKVI